MAVEARPELVGKRFLCVSAGESLELGGISHWSWRAGVIRAVTTRDSDNSTISVCVEWDGETAAEQHWRRLREEWEVFVLEQELVWARRSNSQENSTHLALVFRPLIGQARVGGVSVVEFLSDRQLEFCTEREELRPYEGDVGSGGAVLRADPSGWEQLQAWLRQRQLHHILQLGRGCVTGLRVKVFKHDSKPQWLSGVISHHNHSSRTMTILSDQQAEPLSVDPALVHVLFLDDISRSLQAGENAIATRKAHANKITRMTLNTVNKASNTTATDQASVLGSMQRKVSPLSRKNSQTSSLAKAERVEEEEEQEEESRGQGAPADPSKSRINPGERKRRKVSEEEERDEMEKRRGGMKRLKGGGSSLSSGSEEEEEEESGGSRGRGSPCTAALKSLQRKRCTPKRPDDAEMAHNPTGLPRWEPKACPSPGDTELPPSQSGDSEGQGVTRSPRPQDQLASVPSSGALLNPGSEMEDRSEGASREDSEAVSALLASQENEHLVSMETACVLLHTSPPECEAAEGDQEIPPTDPEVRGSEITHPEATAPSCDSAVSVEEEPKGTMTLSSNLPCNAEAVPGKGVKPSGSPGTASPERGAVFGSETSHKPTVFPNPCPSTEVISKPPALTEASRLKQQASPEPSSITVNSSPTTVTTENPLNDLKLTPAPKAIRVPTPTRHTAPSPTPAAMDPEPLHGSTTPPQSLVRSTNCTPMPDIPTKSPLIIDRNEPFTVYRDPALVRKELDKLPTYIQPPHTPPNPHPKHHLKSPSPSSSSPSLTSTSTHNKILSPTAHLSSLPLPSQSPVCSTHPSIPHPHLLPSLLPGLPPSTALLAGHTRLSPLGLPHHPLALQATPSLLGQSPGTTPLAPLGLYPFLWPTFPNGAHSYSLGLQGSKWPPPENAGISEASLRGNTPSPWLPQSTPVTSVEGQGLRPPLPVRPASADTQRASRSIQPSTPASKTTEEMERRAFTETQSSAHMPLKAEPERARAGVAKNGHAYQPVALEPESPSNRPKQPAMVYDLTGDRTSHYQEESRRILQESIKVAPFTAKLGSDRDPRYPKSSTLSPHPKERERERERDREREKEREREREVHVFRHCLPSRPQSAHPSPTLTQSSYYTPTGGGGQNRPPGRRAPPNKELYERLSGSNIAASMLPTPCTQSSVKAKPPPLVKRHPEKEEGLLGKITEHLASKAVSMEPVELGAVERKSSCTSLISVSTSSSRAVPSLHRAPIFHPPAPPIMASKEVGQGRLSPPTLTPIQPMSLSGKGQNQQRPPTLKPELRHGAVAGKRPVPEPVTVTSQAYDLQRSGALQSQERMAGGNVVNGGVVTPQSATASVIVHPSCYMHMALSYTVNDRPTSRAPCHHMPTFESLSNTHIKEDGVQCKRGFLWTPMDTVHPVNMSTSKQDINMPLNMTTKNMGLTPFSNHAVKYSNTDTSHSRIDLISERCKKDIGRVQPKVALSFSCPPQDLPHVKKRRAGLAAPEPRHNIHTVQPLHTTHALNATKSVLHTSHSRYGTYTTHSTHTVCTAHTIDREKESVFNPSPPKCPRLASEVVGTGAAAKPSSLAKGQQVAPAPHINQPAQSGQNNYHKLKKAWLTRHSEQDRRSVTSQPAGGSQTDTTHNTSTSISLPLKPAVNGVEDKFSNQEGKESFLDNRKSKTLDRKCPPEDRKSNRTDINSSTEDMKPVLGDKKAASEDLRPVVDRTGLEDKEPSSQSKKLCDNERKPSPGNLKDSREEKWNFQPTFKTERGADLGSESESRKPGPLAKRPPEPPLAKKPQEQPKQRAENEREEDEELEEEEEEEGQANGTLQTAKEKSKQRMSNSNGIPRSVLKDWRKVKKLKQTGEAFLQDDSCAEIGANVQKCRECRLDRSRKAQEPAISPVFCRFYYFRRLSYSKNGVVRVDGFSTAEESDEEAVRVWMAGFEDEGDEERREMEPDTAKYILTLTGDKFCQLVKTENTASSWVKKDTQVMWKRAVRGVREMCDACEATLFSMHWACHKCGFVVCMDCYKARERKSAKDKELYAWVRCVKNQPHDLKNLMPTQIVPETVLEELQHTVHSVRREYGIPAHCSCSAANTLPPKLITTNGLSQLSERPQCDSHSLQGSQQDPDQQKSARDPTTRTPAERHAKLECDGVEALGKKPSSPEQGSTLRDLLTSTAGKLRLGSTGPGIAFAPVYSPTGQIAQNTRMPNLLDDIIASVVENKIPAAKMARLGLKQAEEKVGLGMEEAKPDQILLADPHASVPHDWIGSHRLLWLKDHRHLGNQRLFKENWTQEQPVLVSGLQRSLTTSLWKPDLFSRDFSGLHSDLYNCRDGSITNSRVKEFWDGFEDVSKRPKTGKGDPAVYRLKDWPSGEEFLALMPSRYEDVMRILPVPEYTGPNGTFNLASRLPSFFIRPDLGPRLCCAHGVTACPEQDFGTSNLHVEISDTMSILVYVGLAKGNGALSKSGVLKLLEREALDESARRRLRDPGELPGALWHIFLSKDLQKLQDFLQKVSAENTEVDAEADSDAEWDGETDSLREGSWYLSPKLRQRLLDEQGVESRTLLQFYGDAIIIPAGAVHQVMNLHSCIQVNVDFVSPEHAHNSYYLTQELRPLKDQVNYEDKLQVKNIFYHSVKDAVTTLSRHLKEQSTKELKEEES